MSDDSVAERINRHLRSAPGPMREAFHCAGRRGTITWRRRNGRIAAEWTDGFMAVRITGPNRIEVRMELRKAIERKAARRR